MNKNEAAAGSAIMDLIIDRYKLTPPDAVYMLITLLGTIIATTNNDERELLDTIDIVNKHIRTRSCELFTHQHKRQRR